MTGANIKTTTTLSINIETNPASIPTAVTKTATFPFDTFRDDIRQKIRHPDFPKYPEMIQIPKEDQDDIPIDELKGLGCLS